MSQLYWGKSKRELISFGLADDEHLNEEQRDQLETSARHLYGLIHARFIITSRGLAKMVGQVFPSLVVVVFYSYPTRALD